MKLVRALKEDPERAAVDAPTRALLRYADKLTRTPEQMNAEDVETLRSHGFSDRDITDAAHNIAFFAYINRMGQGLGVEQEPFMERGGENVAPDAPLSP